MGDAAACEEESVHGWICDDPAQMFTLTFFEPLTLQKVASSHPTWHPPFERQLGCSCYRIVMRLMYNESIVCIKVEEDVKTEKELQLGIWHTVAAQNICCYPTGDERAVTVSYPVLFCFFFFLFFQRTHK